MRIYIRHADKQYSNGHATACSHDPSITEDGYIKTLMLGENLIKRWGFPDYIVCSPYRRTRETAEALAKVVRDRGGNEIIVKYEIRLSEYLGNHRDRNLDVNEITSLCNPPHPENFFQMDSRVRYHNDEMRELDYQNINVWFVTHGFIINRLGNAMGYKLPRRMPYLGSAIFSGDKNETICHLLINDKLELMPPKS